MDGNTAEYTGNPGCMYDTAGEICGKPPRARGYCPKHYKVLSRAGAFGRKVQPGSAVTPGQIQRNLSKLEAARELLQEHAAELVELLMTAARNAANKGDSKPAEWALLHARAVEPVLTGGAARPGDNAQGVRVYVGVQLGSGNGSPASTVPRLEASTASSLPDTPRGDPRGEIAGCLAPASQPPIIEAHVIPAAPGA